jgi:hypothetical protein
VSGEAPDTTPWTVCSPIPFYPEVEELTYVLAAPEFRHQLSPAEITSIWSLTDPACWAIVSTVRFESSGFFTSGRSRS